MGQGIDAGQFLTTILSNSAARRRQEDQQRFLEKRDEFAQRAQMVKLLEAQLASAGNEKDIGKIIDAMNKQAETMGLGELIPIQVKDTLMRVAADGGVMLAEAEQVLMDFAIDLNYVEDAAGLTKARDSLVENLDKAVVVRDEVGNAVRNVKIDPQYQAAATSIATKKLFEFATINANNRALTEQTQIRADADIRVAELNEEKARTDFLAGVVDVLVAPLMLQWADPGLAGEYVKALTDQTQAIEIVDAMMEMKPMTVGDLPSGPTARNLTRRAAIETMYGPGEEGMRKWREAVLDVDTRLKKSKKNAITGIDLDLREKVGHGLAVAEEITGGALGNLVDILPFDPFQKAVEGGDLTEISRAMREQDFSEVYITFASLAKTGIFGPQAKKDPEAWADKVMTEGIPKDAKEVMENPILVDFEGRDVTLADFMYHSDGQTPDPNGLAILQLMSEDHMLNLSAGEWETLWLEKEARYGEAATTGSYHTVHEKLAPGMTASDITYEDLERALEKGRQEGPAAAQQLLREASEANAANPEAQVAPTRDRPSAEELDAQAAADPSAFQPIFRSTMNEAVEKELAPILDNLESDILKAVDDLPSRQKREAGARFLGQALSKASSAPEPLLEDGKPKKVLPGEEFANMMAAGLRDAAPSDATGAPGTVRQGHGVHAKIGPKETLKSPVPEGLSIAEKARRESMRVLNEPGNLKLDASGARGPFAKGIAAGTVALEGAFPLMFTRARADSDVVKEFDEFKAERRRRIQESVKKQNKADRAAPSPRE